ncbi:MAG TPA: hypothetical protein VNX28_11890 [Gemmataceae bacterium]|jgi:hypothetical protein|nr:hypothetical protein [Gemmataceae bacterium]
MADRLVGIRAKIERAKFHIREVESRFNTFLETAPYEITPRKEPNRAKVSHYVTKYSELPIDIPIIAGEAIHQLRSVLDHLICQLVESNGGTSHKRNQFPVFDSPTKIEVGSTKWIDGVHPDAIKVIDSIKPYKGGCDDIWILNKLNNIDKHRVLLIVTSVVDRIHVDLSALNDRIEASLPKECFRSFRANPERLDITVPQNCCTITHKGAIIGELDAIDPIVDNNIHFTFEIAFPYDIINYKRVVPFLHHLADLVDGIITQFTLFL